MWLCEKAPNQAARHNRSGINHVIAKDAITCTDLEPIDRVILAHCINVFNLLDSQI